MAMSTVLALVKEGNRVSFIQERNIIMLFTAVTQVF